MNLSNSAHLQLRSVEGAQGDLRRGAPVMSFPAILLTRMASAQTVYQAIKAGYRLLDGASDYGNEKEAGEGVRRAIKEGLVKREDLCG